MRNHNHITDFEKWRNNILFSPFRWGVLDCVLFSLHSIRSTTDVDMYSPHAGKYHDRETAYTYLKNHYKSIPDIFDSNFSKAESLEDCIVGDPILLNFKNTDIMGVYSEESSYLIITIEKGVIEIPKKI